MAGFCFSATGSSIGGDIQVPFFGYYPSFHAWAVHLKHNCKYKAFYIRRQGSLLRSHTKVGIPTPQTGH